MNYLRFCCESVTDQHTQDRLLELISEIKVPGSSGYEEYSIPVGEGDTAEERNKETITIRMQVCMVDAEHKFDILAPRQYFQQLLQSVDRLADLTCWEYRQLMGRHRDLFDLLSDTFAADMTGLQVHGGNRTMYFDDHAKRRIGIVCSYYDQSAQPLV